MVTKRDLAELKLELIKYMFGIDVSGILVIAQLDEVPAELTSIYETINHTFHHE